MGARWNATGHLCAALRGNRTEPSGIFVTSPSGSVWHRILEAGELERQRIGQDLHDDLCQHLTGITFLGRVLQKRLAERFPVESDRAGQVAELVEQAVKRARHRPRVTPDSIGTRGPGCITAGLAQSVEAMFGIQCQFHCERPVSISDTASQTQLYRITQEAITNAVRHGKAGTIYIDLAQVNGRLILSVEDNGVGIRDTAGGSGLGLRTMRHRQE